MTSFEEHILPWLQAHCPEAVAVERVSGNGNDMMGDTGCGFHAEFGVDIVYRDAKGVKRFHDVAGEEMASLWIHAVSGWPRD